MEIIFSTVEPHQLAFKYARVRCEIGKWNFDKSHFIATGTGHGMTKQKAHEAALRHMAEPQPMNEESFMLGE